MREETPISMKSEDFVPLMPIDIVSPPSQRGEWDRPDIPVPIEPKEMVEAELDELKDSPEYKGDINAPVDAPHPLADAPTEPEAPL